jgi:hypothetical protein
MTSVTRLCLILAVCIMSIRGETVSRPVAEPTRAVVKDESPRPKKRFRWLRRICRAEVELAEHLSSVGIPQPDQNALTEKSGKNLPVMEASVR